MEKLREQAIRFGTRVEQENIASVDFGQHPFRLKPNVQRRDRGADGHRRDRRARELAGRA